MIAVWWSMTTVTKWLIGLLSINTIWFCWVAYNFDDDGFHQYVVSCVVIGIYMCS